MRSARIYVPRTKFGILIHVAVTCLGVLAIGYFAETISSPAALIPIAEGYGIVGAAILLNIFLIARLENPRNKMATDEWNGRVVTCLCSAGLTMGVAILMKNETYISTNLVGILQAVVLLGFLLPRVLSYYSPRKSEAKTST